MHRRSILALAAFAALSLSLADAEETARLPWNPFANAQLGDWVALAHEITTPSGPARIVVTRRIVRADADSVAVATETRGALVKPKKDQKPLVFARKGAPSLDPLFDLKSSEVKKREVLGDEKRTVGGRELDCTKIRITCAKQLGPQKDATMTVTAWLSKDVKATGVVALDVEFRLADPKFPVIKSPGELVGFGTAEKVLFGKKPEDVTLEK